VPPDEKIGQHIPQRICAVGAVGVAVQEVLGIDGQILDEEAALPPLKQ